MPRAWNLENTPRSTALRRAAAHMRALPPRVLAIRVDPERDAASGDAMLGRSVHLRLVWHPSIRQLADDAGARPGNNTNVLRVPARPTEATRRLWSALHPGALVAPDGSPFDANDLVDPRARDDSPLPLPAAAGNIVVSANTRSITLTLTGPDLPAGPHTIWASRPCRIPARDLPDLVTHARKAGLVLVDVDATDRLTDLGWTYDNRLTLTPATGAPGWVELDTGDLITTSVPNALPAQDALAAATAATRSVRVGIDPLARATATAASAGSAPSPVPGVALRSWQEQFLGRYLAANRGLVNSLPPGAGKTVCTAAAFAHYAAAGPHRALVVAPASLLQQWRHELATFHPAALVTIASSATDIVATDHPAAVTLMTPSLLAENVDVLTTQRIDDLVIDEGTWLRSPSAQTRAAWKLRRAAHRALVLTGTPEPAAVPALVSFVVGDPAAFPTTDVHPDLAHLDELERAGAWLFGHGADLAGALPTATPTVERLSPSQFVLDLESLLVEHTAALLEAATTPAATRRTATALRSVLSTWRAALASPASLWAANGALATRLRAHLIDLGHTNHPGAKVATVAEWLHLDDGPALVFSDSVPALEALHALAPAGTTLLSGKMRPAARARAVEDYNAGKLPALLVAPTGQLGLNLQTCTRVAHLDTPANAATLTQRAARAARIGSKNRDIAVHVPLLTGTADEHWWQTATGATPTTDILTLARNLTKH